MTGLVGALRRAAGQCHRAGANMAVAYGENQHRAVVPFEDAALLNELADRLEALPRRLDHDWTDEEIDAYEWLASALPNRGDET